MRKYSKPLFYGLVISVVSLAIFGAVFLIKNFTSGGLESQKAAERWESGTDEGLRYSQISCFISEDAAFTFSEIPRIENGVRSKLTEDSYAAPDDDARLFIYSAFAEAEASFTAGNNSVQSKLYCTTDDYFLIHPHDMVSGWYYNGSEIMENGIVVNEDLAFRLFGGINVAGMKANLSGIECVILGVTSGPSSESEKKEWTEEPCAYIVSDLAESVVPEIAVTCFEIVLPNPVKDYAMTAVKDNTDFQDGMCEYFENTGRYSFVNLVKNISSASERVTKTGTIYYPFWENAARKADERCFSVAVILVITAVIPLLYVLYIIGILFMNKEKLVMQGISAVSEKVSKIKQKRWEKQKLKPKNKRIFKLNHKQKRSKNHENENNDDTE